MAKQTDLTSLQTLGQDVQALCTFDYTPGEAAAPDCPAVAPRVFLKSFAIAGHDIDAAVLHPVMVERLEADLLAEVLEEVEDERDLVLAEAA